MAEEGYKPTKEEMEKAEGMVNEGQRKDAEGYERFLSDMEKSSIKGLEILRVDSDYPVPVNSDVEGISGRNKYTYGHDGTRETLYKPIKRI
ncbi:MAG: hypothetical protein AAB660_01275 [Patescibacteria group bacterium]